MALVVPGCLPAELKSHTADAFDAFIKKTEERIDAEVKTNALLWVEGTPARLARVKRGEVVVGPYYGEPEIKVPDGLIHDWIGSIFIPGATLAETLKLVQDYDNHKYLYQPEVIDSRLLMRDGNDFKIHLQLLKKKVLTVVLNTDHDVRYFPLSPARERSRSYSTRIAEVEHYGHPEQRELPPGKDHGFLWKLYSYWRFEERDGGTFVECEAISLTRGIPPGIAWAIKPMIRSLPRESLGRTLLATRKALTKEGVPRPGATE